MLVWGLGGEWKLPEAPITRIGACGKVYTLGFACFLADPPLSAPLIPLPPARKIMVSPLPGPNGNLCGSRRNCALSRTKPGPRSLRALLASSSLRVESARVPGPAVAVGACPRCGRLSRDSRSRTWPRLTHQAPLASHHASECGRCVCKGLRGHKTGSSARQKPINVEGCSTLGCSTLGSCTLGSWLQACAGVCVCAQRTAGPKWCHPGTTARLGTVTSAVSPPRHWRTSAQHNCSTAPGIPSNDALAARERQTLHARSCTRTREWSRPPTRPHQAL